MSLRALPILACAGILFLYLLIEGTMFHRSLGVANEFVSAAGGRKEISGPVGKQLEFESVLANRSNLSFRVVGWSRNFQASIEGEKKSTKATLLPKHGMLAIRTQFMCKTPGRIEIPGLNIRLRSRSDIYRTEIRIQEKVTVTVRPVIDFARLVSVDSVNLTDLTPDRSRRGSGTDLAAVRPATVLYDMHDVDWKATARTGNLMVKEFYLEREPSIVLLIDASRTMKVAKEGSSTLTKLLAILPSLLASLKPDTPIGLILHDEDSILADIPLRTGSNQHEFIMRHVFAAASSTTRKLNVRQHTKPQPPSRNKHRVRQAFDSLPTSIQHFYNESLVRQRELSQTQGAFIAFSRTCLLAERCLILAITDGRTNFEGIIGGARVAALSGHRPIVIILTNYPRIQTSFTFPEPRGTPVRVRQCYPEKLPFVVKTEVTRIGQVRILSPNREVVPLQG